MELNRERARMFRARSAVLQLHLEMEQSSHENFSIYNLTCQEKAPWAPAKLNRPRRGSARLIYINQPTENIAQQQWLIWHDSGPCA